MYKDQPLSKTNFSMESKMVRSNIPAFTEPIDFFRFFFIDILNVIFEWKYFRKSKYNENPESDYINSKFHFIPDRKISINESVTKFKDKISFLIYNKSIKWGMDIYVLSDVQNTYMICFPIMETSIQNVSYVPKCKYYFITTPKIIEGKFWRKGIDILVKYY